MLNTSAFIVYLFIKCFYLGQLSISAVEHVIESLTPNARRIFRLLVEAFLSNSNTKDYEGKNKINLFFRILNNRFILLRNEIYRII